MSLNWYWNCKFFNYSKRIYTIANVKRAQKGTKCTELIDDQVVTCHIGIHCQYPTDEMRVIRLGSAVG